MAYFTKKSYGLSSALNERDLQPGRIGLDILRSDTTDEVYSVIGRRRRNLIDNGQFRFWQRATFPGGAASISVTGAQRIADRWYMENNAGTHTIETTQSTDVPVTPNENFHTSLKLEVTTPSSSYPASTGAYVRLRQSIEGWNSKGFELGNARSRNIVLSFWAKSSVAGGYSVTLFGSGLSANHIVLPYRIAKPNEWQKIVLNVPRNVQGGALDATNGKGLDIQFQLARSGSAYISDASSPPNRWGATKLTTLADQEEWIKTNGATFYLTGVQLEEGNVSTPYEYISFDEEYKRMMRYVWRTGPGNMFIGSWRSSTLAFIHADYQVPMRALAAIHSWSNLTLYESGYWGGSGVSVIDLNGNSNASHGTTFGQPLAVNVSSGGFTDFRPTSLSGAGGGYIVFDADLY